MIDLPSLFGLGLLNMSLSSLELLKRSRCGVLAWLVTSIMGRLELAAKEANAETNPSSQSVNKRSAYNHNPLLQYL